MNVLCIIIFRAVSRNLENYRMFHRYPSVTVIDMVTSVLFHLIVQFMNVGHIFFSFAKNVPFRVDFCCVRKIYRHAFLSTLQYHVRISMSSFYFEELR